MAYRLRDGVSFCQVDGCLVFLDLDADRYFRLSPHLERTLRSLLKGDGSPEEDAHELVRRNVLTFLPDRETRRPSKTIEVPTRSLLESTSGPARSSASVTLEVLGVVAWTQLMLKSRRLDSIIQRTSAFRQRSTAGPPSTVDEPPSQRLREATHQFMRSRLSVPIETCCLLDSLALVSFLARRGLPANLVFGVALDPFAAHCWVQAGTWVLNDTLGNVVAHTPIREV